MVLVALAVVAAALAYLLLRKRRLRRAEAELQRDEGSLLEIKQTLLPFTSSGAYLPERVRRPADLELARIAERGLPPLVKIFRRTQARDLRQRTDSALSRAGKMRQQLQDHNPRFVQETIREHAQLLLDELHLDEAQCEATVRDDERNLVIAGAGSGKTRTIIARVRFLLEKDVPPTAILAVTFTNKATDEMEDRLTRMKVSVADRGRAGVTVSTLHALGKRVVQSTLAEPVSVADDLWTDSIVAAALHDARTGQDPALAPLYLNALLHFHRNEDERAPQAGGDVTYRTLRGEHVRSLGERILADFLVRNQIPYQYEARAKWAQVGQGRDAYHPDFTLPETGACIEYWGVNRQGKVPEGWATSSSLYAQGMEWKRKEFKRTGRTLIEFYDYERIEGGLEKVIPERLAAAGVVLRPMSPDQIQSVSGDMKYIGSAIEALATQFITNARSLRRSPQEILRRIETASPRVHHFGLLGIALLERYEAALAAEGRIDFSDMLHRAADILERGTNPLPRFQHILVDEFQDTSAAMALFLRALVAVNGARLFAVGDDWQAIYGFAGGDVDHIVNFEKHFGPASTTMLNVNYRSPAVIVEAGSALIAHNPDQIMKHVVVSSPQRGEAFVHEAADDDDAVVGATIRLIQEERQRGKPDDILVLSRTNHLLPPIVEACRRNRIPVADVLRNSPGVRILSGHKAKGLEAPVVIVVNASDHVLGFPCKVENPDVLGPVRMSTGNDAAEERRLFYVAITRAMARLHLIARRGLPSPYIAEIENAQPVTSSGTQVLEFSRIHVGNRLSAPFHVERLYALSDKQKAVGIRQSGVLTTTTNRFSFTSWAPFDLDEGASYWLGGAVKERPFGDQLRIKLDRSTSAQRQAPAGTVVQATGSRMLAPRPPPALQPRLQSG